MTITLCITALADRTELYQQVLLASTALWFLGRSILLVDNHPVQRQTGQLTKNN